MNRSSLSGAIIALLTVVPAFADDGANGIDLQLEEAQRLAVSQQPLLAAQTQAVKAARENAVAAAQLPDPKLAVGVTDWPINGADRYSLRRDEFTMVTIGVMQDFPRALKRRLRGQRGEHEAELQQQMLDATRLAICRDAGIAWLDVWKPEQSLKLVLAAAHEAELQKQVTQTAYTTGRVTQAEAPARSWVTPLSRFRKGGETCTATFEISRT